MTLKVPPTNFEIINEELQDFNFDYRTNLTLAVDHDNNSLKVVGTESLHENHLFELGYAIGSKIYDLKS